MDPSDIVAEVFLTQVNPYIQHASTNAARFADCSAVAFSCLGRHRHLGTAVHLIPVTKT